jgi:hypothetical protein
MVGTPVPHNPDDDVDRWVVERIVRFPPGAESGGGYSLLGFHDPDGAQLALLHGEHWVGVVDGPNTFEWTAGRERAEGSRLHIEADLRYPMYLARHRDGSYLVSNFGNGRIFRILPQDRRVEVFVDGETLGLVDVGNCVPDDEGYVWVNEVTGCRIWRFDPRGRPDLTLGTGEPGFDAGTVPLEEARFSWVYDIRLGPDGLLYALDSRNFAVRSIDLRNRCVGTIAGTGEPGYSGDGGDARLATFGSDPDAKFDGPLSLSLDEMGNVFVGDTRNHVVRMVDRSSNVISTIAGDPSAAPGDRSPLDVTDPRALKLFEICSMDYFGGRLSSPR